jgi:uncharacterized membrane protein YphA (DoxX/SURF4 family)
MYAPGYTRDLASLSLRLALALTFLYSVADRFGLLGPPGVANVSWGTFARFTSFVGVLNWYLPHAIVPAVAWIDTALEIFLGLALLAGLWLRPTAVVSALLLFTFAITMSIALGIGAPFAYSVFTASAGAFLLASTASSRWSLDCWLRARRDPEEVQHEAVNPDSSLHTRYTR